MRRFVLLFLIGILFLTLQATLLTSFPIQRIRPDLLLILTLYLGLSYPLFPDGILAFLLGYLMDLFSGNSLGLYALSRPVVFFAAQLFKERFYLERYPSQSLLTFGVAMMEGLLILILMSVFHLVPLRSLHSLLFTFLLPQAFFTSLVTPVVFSLIDKGSFLSGQHRMGIEGGR